MQVVALQSSNETQKALASFLEQWKDSKSYIIQNTSGSTGTPKEIRIEKELMMASARTTNNFFNIGSSSSLLLCISPDFIGGKMMIVRALIARATLFVSNISSNPILHLTETIDLGAMVPLQAEKVYSHPNFHKIKNLIIGGAPVSDELEKSIAQTKVMAYSSFGMTETVSHIALKILNSSNAPFSCLPPTSVSTNSDHQLVINAPHLSLTELVTNDVVELIDNRNFYWKGRSDFTINSGGIKFQPEEIEKKLVTLFPNQHFLISSLKDHSLGEKIILCVEGKIESLQAIKNGISEILGKYEQPKAIYSLPSFSYTANGKLDRIKTKDRISFEGNLQ